MEVSLVHFGKSFQWHCSWNLEDVNAFSNYIVLQFPYILSCKCTFSMCWWKCARKTFKQLVPWIISPKYSSAVNLYLTLGSSGRKISAKLTVNLKIRATCYHNNHHDDDHINDHFNDNGQNMTTTPCEPYGNSMTTMIFWKTLCTIWKAILSLIHPLADPKIVLMMIPWQ